MEQSLEGPALTEKERAGAQKTIDQIAARIGAKVPWSVPARKTPLEALGFDLDGRLWIEHSVTAGTSHVADVYDRTGRWLSTMEWPTNVSLRSGVWAVKGRTGLGVVRDSLGVTRPVRLQFK
jgi:hypothetical protein